MIDHKIDSSTGPASTPSGGLSVISISQLISTLKFTMTRENFNFQQQKLTFILSTSLFIVLISAIQNLEVEPTFPATRNWMKFKF